MGRRGKRGYKHFVRLSTKTLRGQAFRSLKPSSALLYLQLKAKYNGSNNGDIKLYYSELKGIQGLSSPSTISNAFKELIEKGWVKKTEHGGLYRYSNSYKLTWEHDELS